MSRVNRVLWAAVISFAALAPMPASAASPTPSPGLSAVLAAPPAGFTELTSSPFHGQFTAHEYAANADAGKQSNVESTLAHDGFVDGFGKTWVHQATQHVLIEDVIAFTGGKGARDWLTQAEAGDKKQSIYKHANTMSGIDPYFGEHVADDATKTYGDLFAFVKGNDVFALFVISSKDDALPQVTAQTRIQYDAAPPETIPSSQWPENTGVDTSSAAYKLGGTVGGIVVIAFLIGLLGFVAAMIRRNNARRAAAQAIAGASWTTPGGVQLSPDGNYWWDGHAWRDAAQEAPPGAQHSSDGAFWWDGRTWRPSPQVSPPPTS